MQVGNKVENRTGSCLRLDSVARSAKMRNIFCAAWPNQLIAILVTAGVLFASSFASVCRLEPFELLSNQSEATLEIRLPDLFSLVSRTAQKQLSKFILGELISFPEIETRSDSAGHRHSVALPEHNQTYTEGQIMELNTALICSVVPSQGPTSTTQKVADMASHNESVARLRALESILALQGDWIALVRLESVWQEVRRRLSSPQQNAITTNWPCYSLLHQAFYAILFGAKSIVFDIGDSVLDRIRRSVDGSQDHTLLLKMLLFGNVVKSPDLEGMPLSSLVSRKLFEKFCATESEKALSNKTLFFVTGRYSRALIRHLEMKFSRSHKSTDTKSRSIFYPPSRAYVRIVHTNRHQSKSERSVSNRTRLNPPVRLRQLANVEKSWLSLAASQTDREDKDDTKSTQRERDASAVKSSLHSPLNAAKVYLEIIIFVGLFFIIFLVFMAAMCRVYLRQRAARHSASNQSHQFLQRRTMLRQIIAQTPVRGYKPRIFDDRSSCSSRETNTKKIIQCNSCAICLGDFSEGNATLELPCKHVFHVSCIQRWLGIARLCRQQNGSTQLILSDRASVFSNTSEGEQQVLDNRMACPLCLQDVVTTFNQKQSSGKNNLLVTSELHNGEALI